MSLRIKAGLKTVIGQIPGNANVFRKPKRVQSCRYSIESVASDVDPRVAAALALGVSLRTVGRAVRELSGYPVNY